MGGVGGICTPQQCATTGAKMPVAQPQAVSDPQTIQSTTKPVLLRPAGSMDISV